MTADRRHLLTSKQVAEFVGDINLFEGQLETQEAGRLLIATKDAGTLAVTQPHQPVTKSSVCVAIRPEKIKLSRRSPTSDGDHARAINRLEGVVTEVSYLGGITSYKVKLDSGATVRSSMANTARIEIDAYQPCHRVVAWFTPDDCLVLQQ